MTPAAIEEEFDKHEGLLPEHLRAGLLNYLLDHIRPGHFLQALLSNNLHHAVARADPVSLQHLREIVLFLFLAAPSASWGSPEAMEAWIALGEEAAPC